MKLRVGYELQYDFPQPTPVVSMLNIHFTRVSDLASPDHMVISPPVPVSGYRDGFGNWCTRFLAPTGRMLISADSVVNDTGRLDPVVSDARQIPVEELRFENRPRFASGKIIPFTVMMWAVAEIQLHGTKLNTVLYHEAVKMSI